MAPVRHVEVGVDHLFGVAAARAQTVGADMADIGGGDSCAVQRFIQDVRESRFVLTHAATVADCRGAKADDFAQDFRPASLSRC